MDWLKDFFAKYITDVLLASTHFLRVVSLLGRWNPV